MIAFKRRLRNITFINIYTFSFIEFRSGKAPILIATDVASRGLGMEEQQYLKKKSKSLVILFALKFYCVDKQPKRVQTKN